MGIAAINDEYICANEIGLQKWIDCFGEGVRSSLHIPFISHTYPFSTATDTVKDPWHRSH